MASIGRKLEKKGVIAMTLLTLVLIGTGCEDSIDNPAVRPSEGKTVEVSLHIGFADEVDGYTVDTKSGTSTEKGAFSYELQPNAITKGDVSVKPDQLYNLEIQQYDQSGKRIGGVPSAVTQQTGSAITLTLAENLDCQLVIVAWGDGNTTPRLGTSNTLEAIQKLSIDASVINNIPTDNMNKMPYILHLEHVKVSSDKRLQNVDGKDARLLLKRLAARLTLNWTYSYSGYKMKQILLQSIPLDYKIVPAPDKTEKTYPSLLDQYTTKQLTENEIATNEYSCWIPANVRGTNSSATSQTYRIKSNAPIGSSYVDFIASNATEAKKKLSYRVYLGGAESSDFNLHGNTDYNYTVRIQHDGLPINDRRVTIIDPIPASENNNNLVPTANCFMVVPGGAFCFNPYNYYVKGTNTENNLLRKWCSSTKIRSVKVIWQTKENGDVGDPALGTAISNADHTNIVDLKNGDSFTDARIYCRVAPNTSGGSGLIAAYDDENGTGNILWSWHIWVTDYAPSATAEETVLEPENKRVMQFRRSGTVYKPMMDRCLGAYDGYTSAPQKVVDQSRANGFHYQRGRKDPFPGSYPSEEIPRQYKFEINAGRPPKNCLNRYKSDGITWVIPSGLNMTSIHHAYQHPESFGNPQSQEWSSNPDSDLDGRAVWSESKTVHDPCPAGWRIATRNELQILIDYNSSVWNTILTNSETNGGVLLQYDETANRTYMRFSGYPADLYTLNNVGYTAFLAMAVVQGRSSPVFIATRSGGIIESSAGIRIVSKDNRDAQNIRCIQDR